MPNVTTLATAASLLLKQQGQTIGVAESSAGGIISASLVAQPGASAYYLGGTVVYTRPARDALLRIPDSALSGVRSASEQYALLMARSIRQQLGATWGLSETGASGPTGNRYGDQPGHACMAVTGPVERAITVETRVMDRESNMWTFARAALDLLERCLREATAGRSA
jgi:PncC family amidohydrolase